MRYEKTGATLPLWFVKATMTESDSDDSDEWGMEELVLPPKDPFKDESDAPNGEEEKGDDEDYWKVEPKAIQKRPDPSPKPSSKPSEPMIIVDMTQIDRNIHSKYDKNSVNDSARASALRKKIESDYEKYSKDSVLLAEGTIIPCGSSVWRGALIRLRDEREGHYFAPIFPPRKK